MSNSLRDQLFKTGMVSKEQAKKVEKQTKSKYHQQQKQNRKNKKQGKTEAVDTKSSAYIAAQAQQEEIARAKELNRQKEAERVQKALQAQVRDMIQNHQVNDSKADISYNFSDGKFIKKIYVNAKQQQQLINRHLAITILDESYYLVPASIGEKLLERVPEVVVYLDKDEEKATDADDPYADYQVPDDLMW